MANATRFVNFDLSSYLQSATDMNIRPNVYTTTNFDINSVLFEINIRHAVSVTDRNEVADVV